MATLSTVEYLALSQFAYNDFSMSTDTGKTIEQLLIEYPVEHEGEPVLAALDGINNWVLVGARTNSETGFAATQADKVMMSLRDRDNFEYCVKEHQERHCIVCWDPIPLETKEAQAVVQEAMSRQFDRFVRSMEEVRFIVDHHTDKQIFNDDFKQARGKYPTRYHFIKATGQGCQIFDTNSGTILNQRELDYYLKKPKGKWAVQVDCYE